MSRDFSSVEVNRSFYSLLAPSTYRNWKRQVPADFRFSVKGSRYITHMKSLREVETALANFFASGILELKGKLDTCLWQLPDSRRIAPELIAEFLSQLPASLAEAAELATTHDERLPDFVPPSLPSAQLRHAIELRRLDAVDELVLATARSRNIAVAISNSSRWPLINQRTANFSYLRLHGPSKLYDSEYGEAALEGWAHRISELAEHGDVLVYFDNDGHAHAPRDAFSLIERLTVAG